MTSTKKKFLFLSLPSILVFVAIGYLSCGCQANGQQLLPTTAMVPDQPILLHAGMIASVTGRGDTYRLVDGKDLPITEGEPLPGGAPWDKTFKENGLNRSFIGAFNDGNIFQDANLYYPLEVIIDLEMTTPITQFCLTDLNGEGTISMDYLDEAKNWKNILTNKLDQNFRWVCYEDINCTTRFLKLTFSDPGANIGEIRLFSNNPPRNIPTILHPPAQPYATFKELVGVNINTEDPIYQMSLFEFAREYHDWHLEMGDNKPDDCKIYSWNPSNAYAGWSFDKLYDDMNDAGVILAADLKGNIPALEVHTREDKPIAKNGDPQNPAAYAAHGEYMYQFTARYGQTKLPESTLAPRVQESVKSGLGMVHYVENWNEQDKFWMGRSKSKKQRAAYFNAFEYAAMLSTDYDGHENTVFQKPTNSDCNQAFPTGVKNADPKTKVVMSGITGLNLDYVKGIYTWAKMYRKDQAFPADVLNFHHYSNNFGGQAGGPTRESKGVSPEEDDLYGRLKKLVTYRNLYLPDKEIWISEFGYDVHQKSPQRVSLIGNFDAEEVQGQWLVRSFLAIAAAGIDKAQLFTLTDHYHGDPAQRFSTCGLLELAKEQNPNTPFPEFRARKAYYYLYAMKTALRDFRFSKILKTDDPKISAYEFSHSTIPGKKVYALWANTTEDYRHRDYSFTLSNDAKSAHLLTLLDQDIDGDKKVLKLNNRGLVIPEISERPVFILTDDDRPDFPECAWNISINKSMVSLENGVKYGDPASLIDEPTHEKTSTLRQPICGNGGTPINAWIPLPGEVFPDDGEVAVIIDLQSKKLIKGISVFDGVSQGWLRIDVGEPGNWKPFDRYRTTKYQEWKHWLNMDIETRYLRVICEDPGAVINEVVVLGW